MSISDVQTERTGILIVEDDPDVLRVLRRLLQSMYQEREVMTAGNGNEALEQLAEHPIALVLTDYNMPEMNGLDLAIAIKSRMPEVRVVLITAFATSELERRAREVGVDFFLPKPFQLEEVELIVGQALS
jgi:two-component system, response regulator, stage 0 sporulation protein F